MLYNCTHLYMYMAQCIDTRGRLGSYCATLTCCDEAYVSMFVSVYVTEYLNVMVCTLAAMMHVCLCVRDTVWLGW
jgi:hypothetical protein